MGHSPACRRTVRWSTPVQPSSFTDQNMFALRPCASPRKCDRRRFVFSLRLFALRQPGLLNDEISDLDHHWNFGRHQTLIVSGSGSTGMILWNGSRVSMTDEQKTGGPVCRGVLQRGEARHCWHARNPGSNGFPKASGEGPPRIARNRSERWTGSTVTSRWLCSG